MSGVANTFAGLETVQKSSFANEVRLPVEVPGSYVARLTRRWVGVNPTLECPALLIRKFGNRRYGENLKETIILAKIGVTLRLEPGKWKKDILTGKLEDIFSW